ncbi:MAG TPA: PIN domain-containing protein [Candidatus Limnocylindrales bacterium]|nr:PIN domain-containing protein [Candidatus Limnocylindrales bacterium]
MSGFIRLFGGALGAVIAVTLAGGAHIPPLDLSSIGAAILLAAWIGAWFVIGFSILPYVTVVPTRWLIGHVMDLSTGEFVSAIGGLIVGLLIGLLIGLPMANLPDPYRWLLPIGTVVVTGLGMMGLTVAKRHDLAEALRSAGLLRQPAADVLASPANGPVIYVDTSALIDGRLTDVVASGFLWGTLVVPRFVVAELQHIADQHDQNRRARGRRGLEMLSILQKDPRVAVELNDEDVATESEVDAKLIALARRRGAGILTNDFNLNRVAQLDDVRVLNLNHLANALKPAFLPGDGLRVKVISQGKEPGQGLAYLDDGTMIVVEGGGTMIDTEIEVTVVRVLQTVAGRMVFAQPRV